MSDRSGAAGATEFTTDWTRFEVRLAALFGQLALTGVAGKLVLRYETGDGMLGEVSIHGALSEASGDGASSTTELREAGVKVLLPERPATFYPLEVGSEAMSEAARDVCDFLRAEALVAHPSLLTAEADGIDAEHVEALGLPGPDGVLREARLPKPRKRRVAAEDDGGVVTDSGLGGHGAEVWPAITWPRSVDEVRDAVEEMLSIRFGSATMDDDGDYVIETSGGGSRFYLTVINDEPYLAFRKAVVLYVNSRRSAVIEANYLTREHPEIRWVLRGHTLYQEYSFSTAPFVPVRFVEMLDEFDLHYRANVSALRMRLGGDD